VNLLVVALFLLAGPVAAQGNGSRLGITAGVAMSKLSGEGLADIESVKQRLGLHLGAFAELGLSRMMAIQPEVAYVMRGTKLTDDGNEVSFKLNWLEAAALLKVAFPGSGSGASRPFLYAGPAMAFQMGCTAEGQGGGTDISADCEEFGAEIRKSDLAAIVGGGVDFGRLSIGARYTLGLSDLNDAADGTAADAAKSRSLSILLGYALRLNGR